VPLNRPALALGSGPRGVQDARRWVVSVFRDMGRDDLVECAEMAVSELVTNALLHAEPPIHVRVRGTHEHPRVEVADASTEVPDLPRPPSADDDLDDLLLTFGRGLSIVARASEAWGAEIEDEGKTVWFTPAAEFSEDDGPEGQITGVENPALERTGEHPTDVQEFHLLGVPVRDYTAFQNHVRELRREVRLLALAHQSDYPLAQDLSDVFDRLGRPLRLGSTNQDVRRAQQAGEPTVDLTVLMSRAAAEEVGRFIELLDLTDAFCRAERMLSLARSPEQVAFQTWYFGEFVRQVRGEAPQAWPEPVDDTAVQRRMRLS
jgi:anti-sigma regulatory factor (Ser/Thr protein kinase)